MGRIPLPPVDSIDPEIASQLRRTEQKMGHIPHNGLLFARVPGLAPAMIGLSRAILTPGRVGMELKWLVGHVSSRVAGCKFCWAHTAANAVHQDDVDPRRFEEVWAFETSELFDDRDRAALRLAAAAGSVPNLVTDELFDDVRRCFDDDEILELVAVIAMFGFMNRWNDTLSVPLEELPLRFAQVHLAPTGWDPGRHI
jgi:uncharacterized peroxidase-related enzyme